ncbi:glycosyltransferase family 1 protein, partial [Alphaproteobacteria bacterium]|nr:glycosyltransferase family 1 protein [Alphaproteobacteria bacterium]
MRIIISSNTSWNIYNFRFGFVQSLLKNGHKIFIITQGDYTDKFLKEIGCEMHNINFKPRSLSLINNLKILVNYFLISRKIKPDLIFNFTIKPNIIG